MTLEEKREILTKMAQDFGEKVRELFDNKVHAILCVSPGEYIGLDVIDWDEEHKESGARYYLVDTSYSNGNWFDMADQSNVYMQSKDMLYVRRDWNAS